MNNVKNSISWADFTWNPITGCKRGCSYCYARRIHERFNRTPFSDIEYHPDRLKEPARVRKPAKIFVGSMSDIEFWNIKHTEIILSLCQGLPRHTFMFLSKSPESYRGIVWPRNTMQGLTLTCKQSKIIQYNKIADIYLYPHPFLSVEPILGELKVIPPVELVIVGAMTGPGAIPPKPEWIQSIKDNVPADRIYWKKNIRKYLP